jgi:hypothetical protein
MTDEEPQEHRGDFFKRFLATIGVDISIAGAVSQVNIPGVSGAPRNPNLKPAEGTEYAYVRTAEGLYTYTQIQVEQRILCRKCGQYAAEQHDFTVHHETSGVQKLGSCTACRNCEEESWMFTSHMPRVMAWQERRRRNAQL